MKLQQEKKGLCLGFFYSGPQFRKVKACSYPPNGESIPIPNLQMEGTSPRLHGDHKVPAGDDPPCVSVEVPPELTEGLGSLAGTVMAMMVST